MTGSLLSSLGLVAGGEMLAPLFSQVLAAQRATGPDSIGPTRLLKKVNLHPKVVHLRFQSDIDLFEMERPGLKFLDMQPLLLRLPGRSGQLIQEAAHLGKVGLQLGKALCVGLKLLNAPSTYPFNYYTLGAIYALKGDVQAALQMLESAFVRGHRRHQGIIFYGDHFLYGNHLDYLYDPDLDNVRDDPRTKEGFAALLEKVKASYPAIGLNKGAEK